MPAFAGMTEVARYSRMRRDFHPSITPGQHAVDLRTLTREFYTRFYHVTPSDAQIDRVLAGRD